MKFADQSNRDIYVDPQAIVLVSNSSANDYVTTLDLNTGVKAIVQGNVKQTMLRLSRSGFVIEPRLNATVRETTYL